MSRVVIICHISHIESSVHCHESLKIAKCHVHLKELDAVDRTIKFKFILIK